MPAPFESLKQLNGPALPHRPKDANGTANWSNKEFRSLDNFKQDALLIHAAGEKYQLVNDHDTPEPAGDAEALIQVLTIGLNPVDWKGADFDFGQPSYPWINGRDFAGVVVRAPSGSGSRLQKGNVVFGCSTDYRDIRKASFQEYLIANDYNVSRLPDGAGIDINEVAALGTAFIAATVGLGVCFGIDFSKPAIKGIPIGPDLLTQARIKSDHIPKDTHDEVTKGITGDELPRPGEWIVVWGAGVAGQFFCQLAKFAGLKVACVDDLTQVGHKLADLGLDLMIDFKAHEPERIIEILRAVTGGKLRFGVDTVGKKTAEELQKAVQPSDIGRKAHIAGLSGLPDEAAEGVVHHKALPIKLFHELPNFGEEISQWLEELLATGSITLPQVEIAEGGLGGVNDALDRLRRGESPGKRLVVPLRAAA